MFVRIYLQSSYSVCVRNKNPDIWVWKYEKDDILHTRHTKYVNCTGDKRPTELYSCKCDINTLSFFNNLSPLLSIHDPYTINTESSTKFCVVRPVQDLSRTILYDASLFYWGNIIKHTIQHTSTFYKYGLSSKYWLQFITGRDIEDVMSATCNYRLMLSPT